MVSADTIFSRFSITLAQFLGGMVVEMAPKPSKREEHNSKRLRPKNKNGQNYPILGLIDGGGVPLTDLASNISRFAGQDANQGELPR